MVNNVHTFKAYLVAKGYTQTYGVDYGETFSLVADIRAIRTLLAIAVFYDYEIWQIDVKTAFLNGHLSEDVYMVQPEGFVDPNHPIKVCKLQRSIYGLKQASRSWNKRFDEEIKKIGFTQNPDEPCIYLKASGSNVAFLFFSMKDLGEATYILGIKIVRLIALSQSAYLEKILKNLEWKTPRRGSKLYAVRCTRPDVAFTNTKDMVLVYGAKHEDKLKVSCYADASFQTDKDDTKSQTGYVFVLNGGAMDWKSAKQSTTAMSSIEAEYIAATKTSMEAV
ncbi:retrotransposon protein, putative, ty1-copia subclass [Tanacetum coccineum]